MKTKKQNGISLIALVVTIILLLILAAITTNFIVGDNGIIKKAKVASETYTNAQNNENEDMLRTTNELDTLLSGESGISINELNQLLYPNKTLNVTAFTDTTTEQTYEVPKNGMLYISGYRMELGYSAYFYRNDMLILHIWGAPQATTGASSANSVYIPVKKGDIIKKTQAMNNYNFVVNLYYYE